MTIQSSAIKAGPFNSNGVTVTYNFAFKTFTAGQVRVVRTSAAGAETDLVVVSDYSILLNADQDNNPGGSITTVAVYADGQITIVSNTDYLQGTDIQNAGGFYPQTIEDALDKLTLEIQQLGEQITRSVKVSISSTVSPDDLVTSLQTAAATATTAAATATAAAGTAGGSATAAAASALAAANTPVAVPTHAATSKATPVDADEIPLVDSAALFVLKRLTWANLKATLKTYFDTLYTPKKLVQIVATQFGAVATGTTLIPADNTIPQITEGDQYMTQVITPTNAGSTLEIEITFIYASSAASSTMTAALFQDAIANALSAAFITSPSAGYTNTLTFKYTMIAGTTSATTFRVRGGSDSAGTTTFNGFGGAQKLGGVLASRMTIKEYLP